MIYLAQTHLQLMVKANTNKQKQSYGSIYTCGSHSTCYQMPVGKLLLKIESSKMNRWYIYGSFI